MSFVSSFERESTSPYYRVTVCNRGNELRCNKDANQYHLLLNEMDPLKGKEVSEVLTTKDRGLLFIKTDNIDTPTVKKEVLDKLSCWNIDPCTPKLAPHCCNPDYRENSSAYTTRWAGDVIPNARVVRQEVVADSSTSTKAKATIEEEMIQKQISNRFLFLFFISIIAFFIVLGIVIAFVH